MLSTIEQRLVLAAAAVALDAHTADPAGRLDLVGGAGSQVAEAGLHLGQQGFGRQRPGHRDDQGLWAEASLWLDGREIMLTL